MALHVQALQRNNQDEFDGFYAIYSTAFPHSEQKSRDTLLDMISSAFFTVYLAYNDEKIVGFCMMYHALNEDFFLLEYMAVNETLRGVGLGSTLLKSSIEQLYKAHGIRALLIEIESPDEPSLDQKIREKREQFYRHLGALKIDSFDYILALESAEEPPKMKLLVYHPNLRAIPKETLQKWLEKIYVDVYGCAQDDPCIAFMLRESKDTLHFI